MLGRTGFSLSGFGFCDVLKADRLKPVLLRANASIFHLRHFHGWHLLLLPVVAIEG